MLLTLSDHAHSHSCFVSNGLAPAQSRFAEFAIITPFLRASQTCIRHVHTSKPRPYVLNFFIFCRSLKCTILHQNLRITHSSMHDAVGCRLMYAYVRLSCCMPSFVIPLAVTSPSSKHCAAQYCSMLFAASQYFYASCVPCCRVPQLQSPQPCWCPPPPLARIEGCPGHTARLCLLAHTQPRVS